MDGNPVLLGVAAILAAFASVISAVVALIRVLRPRRRNGGPAT